MALDPELTRDRLLWLEGSGLRIAIKARRLRSRVGKPWVSEGDLLAEMARLSLEVSSRNDEIEQWGIVLGARPWWRRLWARVTGGR